MSHAFLGGEVEEGGGGEKSYFQYQDWGDIFYNFNRKLQYLGQVLKFRNRDNKNVV